MADTEALPVLRRKLAPTRPRKAPGQDVVQLLLANTMPRDADKLLGLEVAVMGVDAEVRPKAEVVAAIEEFDLVYLMKSEDGPQGVYCVSLGLLSAMAEMLMSGRVSVKEPAARAPTRTDGVVASDIVDRWIESARTEAKAQKVEERFPIGDYYRSTTLNGAKNAEPALDPIDYRTSTISLEVSGGARSGKIWFATPFKRKRRLPPSGDTR